MLRGGADVEDGLTVDIPGVARADRQDPAGGELAGRGDRRGEALRAQLTERGQGCQLATSPAVQLAERALEHRLTDDRDREDVRLDVPWLVGDDAQLHGWALLRGRAQGSGAGRNSPGSVPVGRVGAVARISEAGPAGASARIGAVG